MPSYVPRREADLVTWSRNLSTKISADPTMYGLDLAQAAEYATLQTAYADAYTTANESSTRTTPTIVEKNLAKQALIEYTREIVEIIQAYPGTTDVMRAELQITIRDHEPSPSPIPAYAPTFHIVKVIGHKIWYTLREPGSDSRGKPDGVIGALLHAFIGDAAPSNPADWQTLGLATRTNSTIILPSAQYPAGSRVWLSASWVNPKGQTGPMSTVENCYISGTVSSAA